MAYGDITRPGANASIGAPWSESTCRVLIRHKESMLGQEIDLLRMHGFGWRREPPAPGRAVGHQIDVDVDVAEECNADG